MVSHQDGGFGRDVVHAILQLMSWGDLGVVHAPLLGKPAAVEDITYDQDGAADQKYQYCIHKCFCSSPYLVCRDDAVRQLAEVLPEGSPGPVDGDFAGGQVHGGYSELHPSMER